MQVPWDVSCQDILRHSCTLEKKLFISCSGCSADTKDWDWHSCHSLRNSFAFSGQTWLSFTASVLEMVLFMFKEITGQLVLVFRGLTDTLASDRTLFWHKDSLVSRQCKYQMKPKAAILSPALLRNMQIWSWKSNMKNSV